MSELERIKHAFGTLFPRDYQEFLKRVNGQPECGEVKFPPDQLTFLSVEEIASLWEEQLRFRDDGLFHDFVGNGKVRSVLFHPGRIPIAQYQDGGACLWIDTIPGPNGLVGQIVFNFTEVDLAVVEDNFTALLGRYVHFLESGVASVLRVPHEYGEGFWFESGGRYMDFSVYEEAKTIDSV
ncbi:SMI1/KNR4 family protein [Streptomonospora wellingtoniae]|uniref:SMI1/KNR4 family protein n=1 Tax=Streptomonospora wellingtoniae TaxID=3075544 RepID=A0ABU2KXM0_9ACTN|nr:SMI1/KNR4 family protein [Streptomonospora sp. DSM 45055]MDT0304002.1 SMI1/KNR4 family protein [Streptomonospora sp. DSM 45055]